MTEEKQNNKGMNISARSFLTAIIVIFVLMVVSYVLALFVPGGYYFRIEDEYGNMVVDFDGGFGYVKSGIPFWKWLASPVLVLGAEGSGTLIAVIVFLLVIGGIFSSLDKCGLMKHMLERVVCAFGGARYRLMAIVTLLFMSLGAMIGSFEECVPLVPIVVAVAVKLGWDSLTGLGMSLLGAGCGFASGVCNPFTVGVAQEVAGLPMFSGAWLRILSFVLIYALLISFLVIRAKKLDAKTQKADLLNESKSQKFDPRLDRALVSFVTILGVGIITILCSAFIPALQDLTMIIVAVMFLCAGITATLVSGMRAKDLACTFGSGVLTILPAVLMILMASSIKYTLEEANVLDTLLHSAVSLAQDMPRWAVILFIYLIVLCMNFFIPSGSAKAFMLIPLIVPLARIFDISAQLCVVAFAFGDGFSNVFYPTNPVLLISLGVSDVSYGKWFRFSWKFQALNLVLTSLLLLFGLAVGY